MGLGVVYVVPMFDCLVNNQPFTSNYTTVEFVAQEWAFQNGFNEGDVVVVPWGEETPTRVFINSTGLGTIVADWQDL